MQWVHVHIPRGVADEVGATAVRSGIARDQAIAAALWVFSRLSAADRAALIRTYLAEGAEELSAGVRIPGA
jgi:hypothetical protein